MFLAGCGPSVPGGSWPEPVLVTGKITYQGKPFENGTVIFIPDSGTKGQGGSGQVEADGTYSAQMRWTDGKIRDGLVPGKYKVAFSRMVKPDGTVWVPDPAVDEGPANVGAMEEIPSEYSSPGETAQTFEAAEGKTFDFDIP